jgi:hypothetical protein
MLIKKTTELTVLTHIERKPFAQTVKRPCKETIEQQALDFESKPKLIFQPPNKLKLLHIISTHLSRMSHIVKENIGITYLIQHHAFTVKFCCLLSLLRNT